MSSTIIPGGVAPLTTPAVPPGTPGASRLPARPLIVAADGREDVRPAMRVAAAVSARLGAPVRVLAALGTGTHDGAPLAHAAAGAPSLREIDRLPAVREIMRRRMREAADGSASWPVEAMLGAPTETIVDAAADRDAELVLIGAGWHDRSGRPSGVDRALEVAGAGPTPVLAVGREADGTFRRAVAAVDFGPASARAAACAYRLLSPGGRLSLVHVKEPPEFGGAAGAAWESLRVAQIAELFRRLVAALLRDGGADAALAPGARRRDVTIDTVTLLGDPGDEFAAYAERVEADLVALGAAAAEAPRRHEPATVSTRVARRAGAGLPACSVLACGAPSRAAVGHPGAARADVAAPAAELCRATDALDPGEWRLALDGFWRRNLGRRVAVEVDDAGTGAPRVTRGQVLVGASYDPRTQRVELVVADRADPLRRTARVVDGVRSVAVLAAPDGPDEALRVAYADGQVRLTFVDRRRPRRTPNERRTRR